MIEKVRIDIKATDSATGPLKGVLGASKNLKGGFSNLEAGIVTLNQAFELTAKVARGASKAFLAVVETGDKFAKFDIQLKRITGSTKGADDAMAFLRKTARETPQQLSTLTNAFVKFEAVGLENSKKTLTALTDAVAAFGGSTEEFKRATVAISQMAGKGVISMEELRQQLGESVPTAIQIMARELGYGKDRMREFFKLVETGSLDAQTGIEALTRGMTKDFAGAGKDMMKTWSGATSNMQDAWDQLMVGMSKSGVLDGAISAVNSLTTAIGLFAGSINSNSGLVSAFFRKFQEFAIGLQVIANALNKGRRGETLAQKAIRELGEEIVSTSEKIAFNERSFEKAWFVTDKARQINEALKDTLSGLIRALRDEHLEQEKVKKATADLAKATNDLFVPMENAKNAIDDDVSSLEKYDGFLLQVEMNLRKLAIGAGADFASMFDNQSIFILEATDYLDDYEDQVLSVADAIKLATAEAKRFGMAVPTINGKKPPKLDEEAGLGNAFAGVGNQLAGKFAGGSGALAGFQAAGGQFNAAGASGAAIGFVAELLLSNEKLNEALGFVNEALIDLFAPVAESIAPALKSIAPVLKALRPVFELIGRLLLPEMHAIANIMKNLSEGIDNLEKAVTSLEKPLNDLKTTIDNWNPFKGQSNSTRIGSGGNQISEDGVTIGGTKVFHDGGLIGPNDGFQIPGLGGDERFIRARVGETVTPAGQGGMNLTIHVAGDLGNGAVDRLIREIEERQVLGRLNFA